MTTLNIRVDETLKKQASELFADLGLDMSSAVNLFLRQAVLRDGIPFEIQRETPQTKMLAAMTEMKMIENGQIAAKSYDDVNKLFDDLEKNNDDEV